VNLISHFVRGSDAVGRVSQLVGLYPGGPGFEFSLLQTGFVIIPTKFDKG